MVVSLRGGIVVGQSGGPTAVVNSSLVGVVHAALESPEITRVIGARFGVEGILSGDLVDLGQESPRTLETLRRTPAAALGSNRYKLNPADPERILAALEALGVRYFVYIGGNDSADTAHRVARAAASHGYPLRAIHVPKTIDNDLPLTDHCPGYGSAARFVALALRDTGRDTEAMRRVAPIKLVELPGRNAGWVVAAAALARKSDDDAPHLIFPPERRLSLDSFLEAIQRSYDRRGFVVAAVPETLRDENGEAYGRLGQNGGRDEFGHEKLSGAAAYLCGWIGQRLGLDARWDKPGHLVRSSIACVSETDLAEAYLVGRRAVEAALAGETDRMVTLVREPSARYRATTGLVPLESVANRERLLPAEYLTADGTDVTPAFREYAEPLLGGPLPEYGRLRGAELPRER